MKYHDVWLIWASAFLVPWALLYMANRSMRSTMIRASFFTALFGLTEPIFVPRYWNPPSLFELARNTGFDIESLIFSFAIGGIGTVLYRTLSATRLKPIAIRERHGSRHRLHTLSLIAAPVAFVPLAFGPWNVIYAAVMALVLGSALSVVCRPHLARPTLIGAVLFIILYGVFMFGLSWLAPGYIAQVWNLHALSGLLVRDIPIEEFLFGAAFGLYWSSVYEHLTWTEGAP